MNNPTFPRAQLDTALPDLLDCLPQLGRVMVIARTPNVLLERLGTIETAVIEGDNLVLSGADHDARIDAARIRSLIVDRTSKMKDRALPRIEFRDDADEQIFSIVGMEGLEGFDAALSGLSETPQPERLRTVDAGQASELSSDDPVVTLLEPLRADAAHVGITLDVPGMRQAWAGTLPDFHIGMGWFNIISRNFHLHVEGGSVTGWQAEAGRRIAIGTDGLPIGLVVTSDALA